MAQVRFPEVFTRYCAERGIDAVSIPMHIPAAGLADAMRGFRVLQNLIGLSVTIPHKGPIVQYLDRLSERARVGVVNAVRREPDGALVGDTFDGEGFVAGMRHRNIELRGAKVWLVGAGGAGTVIGFALLDAGIGHLTVRDLAETCPGPGQAAGRALAGSRRRWHPRCAEDRHRDQCDAGRPAPRRSLVLRPAELRSDAVVADIIIMKLHTTKLLATAEKLGRRIHHGHHMLDHQVSIYTDFLRLDRARA